MGIENPPKTANQELKLPKPIIDVVLGLWAQSGSTHVIPVRGNSMRPLLREGDQVKVLHGPTDLRRGNIVVYQYEGALIIHRLIKRSGAAGEIQYLMKGDNAAGIDPAIPARKILGRVVALRRTQRWYRLDTPLYRAIGCVIVVRTLIHLALVRGINRVFNFCIRKER